MVFMSMQPIQPLILPPAKPPAQFSTVAFAIVSIMLGLFAVVTVVGSYNFPSNAPVEVIFAWVSAGILYTGALTCALLAIIQELFRKRYREVVTRYAAVTGDSRYLPYISKTYIPWVITLSAIGLILPIVLMIASSMFASLTSTGMDY